MTTTPTRPTIDVTRARKLRQRLALTPLDYAREVKKLTEEATQTEVSAMLGIAQPSISETLKKARSLAPVEPGFSGASPYEIAQRYDVEEINRDEMIDQLSRWKYTPGSRTDGYDSVIVDQPGAFSEVTTAFNQGLLDADAYDQIIDQVEQRSASAP